MLRVYKASGEEVLSTCFAEFVEIAGVSVHSIRVRELKRRLQPLTGEGRFRQQLVLPDGRILSDDAELNGPVDLQLVLLPFRSCSEQEARQLYSHAVRNHVAALEQLLQRSLDPNLEIQDRSPLPFAIMNNCVEAVRILLEASADKDKADFRGLTPLHLAASLDNTEVVRVLLEAHADKEKTDYYGATPLSMASRGGHAEIVHMLTDVSGSSP